MGDLSKDKIRRMWYAVACAGVASSISASAPAATITVGPPTASACGGADCDYQSIQSAIDAATAGDTITIYRRSDDATNSACYNEHVTVDKSLTLAGSSVDPASSACVGPSTGGNIVTVTASNVTLANLHISGRVNDGAGGTNSTGSGGRASGHGIYVAGDDIDNCLVLNCSIDNTFGDNVRYDGDQDNDGDGFILVKQSYLHHSDTLRNLRIINGGGSSSDRHVIRNNLIHTGHGVMLSGPIDYATLDHNVVKGWPFWGHLNLPAFSSFPEVRDGTHGGGWRYYSNCAVGIWVTAIAPAELLIENNLVVATRVGIRVNTTGVIVNNTITNPFNTTTYDYDVTAGAAGIRDETFGLMIASGFAGTITNNIISVTADNRATGDAGETSGTYYTPGITGFGIGFEDNSGTLGAASITNNVVWGFVDTDGVSPLNYGAGIVKGSTNLSVDPKFASDVNDETNGGGGACLADPIDQVRCYELFEDNFFVSTSGGGGSCHANVLSNTAGSPAFVDLTGGGSKDPDTDEFSGLDTCVVTPDATLSRAIDFGTGTTENEDGQHGGQINVGAFGGTSRASESPTLRVADVDGGATADGTATASGPGAINRTVNGVAQARVFFNRAVTASGNSFSVRDVADSTALATPTLIDTSGSSSAPFVVTLNWPAGTFVDRAMRIEVLGDGANRVVDSQSLEALDGEVGDAVSGTLPSGDATAGGDSAIVIYSLVGDVDGDGIVEGQAGGDDYDTVLNWKGYPGAACSGCAADLDADGDVDADDLAIVAAHDGNTPDSSTPARGFESAYGNTQASVNNKQVATKVLLKSGTITAIHAHVGGKQNQNMRFAIYSHDAVMDAPGTLLGETDTDKQATDAMSWFSIDLESDLVITEGVYWLALSFNHLNLQYSYDAGGGKVLTNGSNAVPTGFDATWSDTLTVESRKMSIFAEYQ